MKNFKPVTAKAHTPPYTIHRYFARRPWNVFQQLIENFSKEGEIILDPFCGGGVTIYEGIKLNRKVIGYDLNPLSIFITKNMIKKSIDLDILDSYFERIVDYLKYLYSSYDFVETEEGQLNLFSDMGDIVEWEELAYKVKCHYCGQIVTLGDENKIQNGRFSCTNQICNGNKVNGGFIQPIKCERIGYEYLFSVVNLKSRKGFTKIPFDSERRNNINRHQKFLLLECHESGLDIGRDEIPKNWDRQSEDLLFRKNIKTFQDLFTRRNLLINSLLLNFIKHMKFDKSDNSLQEIFRLVFSSSLRDTNVMAFTNPSWQSGRPATWTKHAYWIPSQFCEVNVLSAFHRAYNRMRKSIKYNTKFDYAINFAKDFPDFSNNSNIFLEAKSIDTSDIPNNLVDVIITDPPYGSNVQYLELSHFWYIWNHDVYDANSLPDFSKEAIANRKNNFEGAKDFNDYEDNLYKVFGKCIQVLKPGKHLVFTFNNKDIRAWLALLIAVFRAGFTFENDGLIYQSGVSNYKHTAHTKYKGSPYGDFIHIFKKPLTMEKRNGTYKGELDFVSDLDFIFSKHTWEYQNGDIQGSELSTRMFIDSIPVIENFVNSPDIDIRNHNLYKTFGKQYLDTIHNYDG